MMVFAGVGVGCVLGACWCAVGLRRLGVVKENCDSIRRETVKVTVAFLFSSPAHDVPVPD